MCLVLLRAACGLRDRCRNWDGVRLGHAIDQSLDIPSLERRSWSGWYLGPARPQHGQNRSDSSELLKRGIARPQKPSVVTVSWNMPAVRGVVRGFALSERLANVSQEQWQLWHNDISL